MVIFMRAWYIAEVIYLCHYNSIRSAGALVLPLQCTTLQIITDRLQTNLGFFCKLLDFCYNYRQILAQTTALQTNDCRYNSWLYLDFERRQTSAFSTVKVFTVHALIKIIILYWKYAIACSHLSSTAYWKVLCEIPECCGKTRQGRLLVRV